MRGESTGAKAGMLRLLKLVLLLSLMSHGGVCRPLLVLELALLVLLMGGMTRGGREDARTGMGGVGRSKLRISSSAGSEKSSSTSSSLEDAPPWVVVGGGIEV